MNARQRRAYWRQTGRNQAIGYLKGVGELVVLALAVYVIAVLLPAALQAVR